MPSKKTGPKTRAKPSSNSPLDKKPDNTAVKQDVDAFLKTVENFPPTATGGRGRLIFALDATASRQPTWDQASAIQGDMFVKTHGLGALNVQLVYYRGYGECRASPWQTNATGLLDFMRKVNCMAGKTQVHRVLKHAIAESKLEPVNALVFVGDCVEEPVDLLGDLAGQLKLLGLPVFIFQEGFDPRASMAFSQIATLSGGAHCRFDQNSAKQLSDLLNAVATYAAGGKKALQRLSGQGSKQATLLLTQLN